MIRDQEAIHMEMNMLSLWRNVMEEESIEGSHNNVNLERIGRHILFIFQEKYDLSISRVFYTVWPVYTYDIVIKVWQVSYKNKIGVSWPSQ